jgi:DNA-binding transcriptional LysR family regulator
MLVFAKVVETKGFSSAARHLAMSRSAVSKHVSQLEQALSARLLNRTTRKLSLTEAGRAAYVHCSRIATEIDEVETSVQPFVMRTHGLLRISAPIAFGRLHLVPVLKDYLKLYPDVAIELMFSDRVVDLADEHFDVAISSYPLLRSNLIRRVLLPLRWIVCCTPDYKKRLACRLRAPNDLRDHNCLYYSALAARDDVWTLSRGDEVCKVAVRGNFRANNSEAVRDAALDGICRHLRSGTRLSLAGWCGCCLIGQRVAPLATR